MGCGRSARSLESTPSALQPILFDTHQPVDRIDMKGLTMTDKTTPKTAGRAALADLHTLAAQGVERALAARGLTELSAEQVEAVSGAGTSLLLKGPLINGIINPEILKALQLNQFKQPQINAGQLAGGVVIR